MAVLRRWKFAARSEQLNGDQRSLLEETLDAVLEAMQTELDDLQLVPPRLQPRRPSTAQARSTAGEPAAHRCAPRTGQHNLPLRRLRLPTEEIAGEALTLYGALYEVERDVAALDAAERLRIRQARAAPAADTLHRWLILHRQKVPDGSATAKERKRSTVGSQEVRAFLLLGGKQPGKSSSLKR